MRVRTACSTVVVAFISAATAFGAQKNYSPAEVDDGGKLYAANCSRCHGPDGDGVAGVNLARGTFRRASTDDELVRIIMNGIPGTAMTATGLWDVEAGVIVAYLHSLVPPAGDSGSQGDAARGKALFEGKGGCQACHRVTGVGARVGPDLSEIGALRRAADLERSLVDPDAEILPENRSVRAARKDGTTITGRLLNLDSFTVQILEDHERLVSLEKSTLRELSFLKKSPMPSYREKLTSREIADVVRYLTSLRSSTPS